MKIRPLALAFASLNSLAERKPRIPIQLIYSPESCDMPAAIEISAGQRVDFSDYDREKVAEAARALEARNPTLLSICRADNMIGGSILTSQIEEIYKIFREVYPTIKRIHIDRLVLGKEFVINADSFPSLLGLTLTWPYKDLELIVKPSSSLKDLSLFGPVNILDANGAVSLRTLDYSGAKYTDIRGSGLSVIQKVRHGWINLLCPTFWENPKEKAFHLSESQWLEFLRLNKNKKINLRDDRKTSLIYNNGTTSQIFITLRNGKERSAARWLSIERQSLRKKQTNSKKSN